MYTMFVTVCFNLKENAKKKSVQVNVLCVLVGGGPYFENAENRRRRRYAVLSALDVSGYSPKDAQHIGYFETESNSVFNIVSCRLPFNCSAGSNNNFF